MSIFARLKKRAACPAGETGLFVRELTFGEVGRVQAVKQDLRTWLTLAFCLVDETGERLLPVIDGEHAEDTAKRMQAAAEESLTISALNEINETLSKLAKPVSNEALAKN
jgi:hypothetical protein